MEARSLANQSLLRYVYPQKDTLEAMRSQMGPGLSLSYCALHNPGFTSPPRVQQVSLTSVRVDWLGLVTRIDCADQFIVKSWNVHNPNDYQFNNK